MKTLFNIAGTIGVLFVGMVGCAALFANSYNTTTKQSEGTAEISDTAWVPEGFTSWNDDVAMKWSPDNSYTCDSPRCIQIEVVSKDGCRSLYVESALLDGSNNNVGYTNATSSGVQPLQKAILKLNTYEDKVESFSLSKISCY